MKVLDDIQDPCSVAAAFPMGLAEMGIVSEVTVSEDGDARVALRLTGPGCHMVGFFNEEVENRVGALPGIRSVVMTFDVGLEWTPELIREETARRRREALEARYRVSG